MKNKAVVGVALFLLPVCLGLVVIEIGLRSIPNSYKTKIDYLESNAETLEVLILGNSHLFYGLDPQYFSKVTFNAAHVAQLYQQDLLLWEKYMDRFESLQYVILPISIQSLYNDGRDLSFTNKNYVIYYGFPNQLNWKKGLELTALPMRANIWRIIKAFFNGEQDYPSTNLGFGLGYDSLISEDLNKNAEEAIKRHQLESSIIVADELSALKSLIEIMLARGIEPILVAAPVSEPYYRRVPQEVLAEINQAIQEISAEYPTVKYLDWNQHTQFTLQDFFDADHLNKQGAKKLSVLLDEWL